MFTLLEMQESSVILPPDNFVEACLLLETAISNTKVQYIQKSLADQLIYCDTLQLRYSWLQVEKVILKLTAAELHVGWVCMVVRHSGYSPDYCELYTTHST